MAEKISKKLLLAKKRTWVLAATGLILGAILWARLFEIQVFLGDEYAQLANRNRYSQVILPPQRGVFFDRYGQPLVRNERVYLQLEPSLSKEIEIPREKALPLLATQSSEIRFDLRRAYKFPSSLSHVLGYIGPVTKEDLLADKSLRVNEVIGKLGLERIFDQKLRGQAGSETYEINALGQRQRLIKKDSGQAGQNISTTLDPYLSDVALAALGEQTGSVVISDANNGQILALVNNPEFDSNLLSQRSSDTAIEKQRREQVSKLLSADNQVFFNRSLSGLYPPGSVFKLVTALAGLESGVIDKDTTVLDEGILKVGQYEYANWYFTQYGRTEGEISLVRALARSNDIYFYKVAEWLGPNRLAEFAHLFGLGKPTGIELGSEGEGLIPDPAWKERVIGEPWFLGNTFHMGIGQGDILVTPLQVTQLTQALGNHGTLCQPSLLREASSQCGQIGVSKENLDLVLEGMLEACSAGGTAYPFFPYNQQILDTSDQNLTTASEVIRAGGVACKTGTAEFGGVDEKGYRSTHGWLSLVMGTEPIQKLAAETASASGSLKVEVGEEVLELNSSNPLDTEQGQAHQEWLKLIKAHDFPEKLIITVLVESDSQNPYKEGSGDAGEVAKKIVDWMMGKELFPSGEN